MPIYSYKCATCGVEFDKRLMGDDIELRDQQECLECGNKADRLSEWGFQAQNMHEYGELRGKVKQELDYHHHKIKETQADTRNQLDNIIEERKS